MTKHDKLISDGHVLEDEEQIRACAELREQAARRRQRVLKQGSERLQRVGVDRGEADRLAAEAEKASSEKRGVNAPGHDLATDTAGEVIHIFKILGLLVLSVCSSRAVLQDQKICWTDHVGRHGGISTGSYGFLRFAIWEVFCGVLSWLAEKKKPSESGISFQEVVKLLSLPNSSFGKLGSILSILGKVWSVVSLLNITFHDFALFFLSYQISYAFFVLTFA